MINIGGVDHVDHVLPRAHNITYTLYFSRCETYVN